MESEYEIGESLKYGWYISPVGRINGAFYYLWKDLELHRAGTGYDNDKHKAKGSAPGYYYSKECAESYLREYLKREKYNMNFKIGDKVIMRDGSYSFGIQDGQLDSIHGNDTRVLTIVKTGLSAMLYAGGTRLGAFSTVNDLLVTDGEGNFFFVQSRFVEPVNKKIEVRYYYDDQDVTDDISDETKRNLSAA